MEELEDEIKKAAEKGNLQSKIEEIVEQKVDQKLKRETQKHSENSGKEISRRNFIKKLGISAAGIGAASLIPSATAFDIQDSSGLNVYTDNRRNLRVGPNGNVSIPNGSLSIPDANGIPHRFESANDGSSGLTLRTTTNQDEIFQVRSSGQAVRFAVYHNDKTYVGDDLEVNNQIFENGSNRVATRSWTNNNFNNYTDSNARNAVDGSNISSLNVGSNLVIPTASEGDEALQEGSIAYDPDQEKLLIGVQQ